MYQPGITPSGATGNPQLAMHTNQPVMNNTAGMTQPPVYQPMHNQRQPTPGHSPVMMNGTYGGPAMSQPNPQNAPGIGPPLGAAQFSQNVASLANSQVSPQLMAPISQVAPTKQGSTRLGHSPLSHAPPGMNNGYHGDPITTVAQPTVGSHTESGQRGGPPLDNASAHAASNKRRVYPNQVSSGVPMPQQQTHQYTAPSPNSPTPNLAQGYHPSSAVPMMNAKQPFQNPQMQQNRSVPTMPGQGLSNSMGRLTVEQADTAPVNLLEQRNIISPLPLIMDPPPLQRELVNKNVDQSVFCSTLNMVPETSSLLGKCKLPFGVHIHPFKTLKKLRVLSPSVIARCKSCRTYLNPFVSILDGRRWQCNMCYRTNEIPEDLCFDHGTRTYIDPRRRPELNCSSIEFIAPSEYMLRPPQPAVFLFLLDVSANAVSTGYLAHFCKVVKENLRDMPGDSRTLVGFVTFNSSVHFYSLKECQTQPLCHVVSDIDDVFLPTPDGLIVNLKENFEMVEQLLDALPSMFDNSYDADSACGAALMAARQLLNPTGGRVTLFQTVLPSVGPGKLTKRTCNSMQAGSKDIASLNPATDFYKKYALDCASEQIGVDLFFLASQYADLASLSCASKYSSGCIHRYPDFHSAHNPAVVETFTQDFSHYLTRNIGFEAVMRVRCTKGLSIHTFHGNFFVRSTDLLSLPNVNPDHGFTMQMSIEDSLTEASTVGFQAALLYTTSQGERRIRVHTLALPVTRKASDVYASVNEQAVAGLLSIMAVDRTLMSSLGDARDALMNACIDAIGVYRTTVIGRKQSGDLVLADRLKMLPLHILSLLKHSAFCLGDKVNLDARVEALQQLKILPLEEAMLFIYPRLYSLLDLVDEEVKVQCNGRPRILPATAEKLDHRGIYLLDAGKALYIFIGKDLSPSIVQEVFRVNQFSEIPEKMHQLPHSDGPLATAIAKFVNEIRSNRSQYPVLSLIRDDSPQRTLFFRHLLDDRSESSMSYREFLLHVQRQLNR